MTCRHAYNQWARVQWLVDNALPQDMLRAACLLTKGVVSFTDGKLQLDPSHKRICDAFFGKPDETEEASPEEEEKERELLARVVLHESGGAARIIYDASNAAQQQPRATIALEKVSAQCLGHLELLLAFRGCIICTCKACKRRKHAKVNTY
jgi:hypothetical protein